MIFVKLLVICFAEWSLAWILGRILDIALQLGTIASVDSVIAYRTLVAR